MPSAPPSGRYCCSCSSFPRRPSRRACCGARSPPAPGRARSRALGREFARIADGPEEVAAVVAARPGGIGAGAGRWLPRRRGSWGCYRFRLHFCRRCVQRKAVRRGARCARGNDRSVLPKHCCHCRWLPTPPRQTKRSSRPRRAGAGSASGAASTARKRGSPKDGPSAQGLQRPSRKGPQQHRPHPCSPIRPHRRCRCHYRPLRPTRPQRRRQRCLSLDYPCR